MISLQKLSINCGVLPTAQELSMKNANAFFRIGVKGINPLVGLRGKAP